MKRFAALALATVLLASAATAMAGTYCQEKVNQFLTAFSLSATKHLIVKDTYSIECKYMIPNNKDSCQFAHTYTAHYPYQGNVEIDINLSAQWHTHYLQCQQISANKTESHDLGDLCAASKGKPVTILDQITLGPINGRGTKTLTKTYVLTCPATIKPILPGPIQP